MLKIDRKELERMYLAEMKSAEAISKVLGCHRDTVYERLRRFEIPIRSSSEAASLVCTGRVSPNKGNKWTPEHHARHLELWRDLDFRSRVIPKRSGSNSNLWKGGSSDPSNIHLARSGWTEVRNECYVRDGGICQDCGIKCLSRAEAKQRGLTERRIQAHHIIPRRYGGSDDISNLVTLCVRCHHKPGRHDALVA